MLSQNFQQEFRDGIEYAKELLVKVFKITDNIDTIKLTLDLYGQNQGVVEYSHYNYNNEYEGEFPITYLSLSIDEILDEEKKKAEAFRKAKLEEEEKRKIEKIQYCEYLIKQSKQTIEREKENFKRLTGIDYNENSD